MNRTLLRLGFVLLLLAMLPALLNSAVAVPRLGLSAHIAGVLGGLVLIAVGAVWSEFSLAPRWKGLMAWCWALSGFANWLGCLVGAVTGAGRTTPVAARGVEGSAAAELAVMLLLTSVVITSLTAVTLSIWGLSRRA